MSGTSWMHFDEIPGGILVFCALCGRRDTKRTFMAANTNYAEARRAATEYHWNHEHSAPHAAALAAFHADEVPPLRDEERVLREIFKQPMPDERELRREAAKRAAVNAARTERESGK